MQWLCNTENVLAATNNTLQMANVIDLIYSFPINLEQSEDLGLGVSGAGLSVLCTPQEISSTFFIILHSDNKKLLESECCRNIPCQQAAVAHAFL